MKCDFPCQPMGREPEKPNFLIYSFLFSVAPDPGKCWPCGPVFSGYVEAVGPVGASRSSPGLKGDPLLTVDPPTFFLSPPEFSLSLMVVKLKVKVIFISAGSDRSS